MYSGTFDKIAFYFESGGWVMFPLALACIAIWYGIGYRWSVLKRTGPRSARRLIEKHLEGSAEAANDPVESAVARAVALFRDPRAHDLRRQLDDELAEDETAFQRYSLLVRTLVAAAPVLGLLGTVTGMIETFDSLGEMKLYSASGGIAGGISQALFTTQLGLAVAIPGLIVNEMLERRARERAVEFAQIKDILCARWSRPS